MLSEPSRTAMGSAVRRADHVRDDAAPWVLVDTMSEQLLAPDERELVRAEIDGWPGEVRAAFRLSHAVRARLAEDLALEGRALGRHDYVLLGAGMDTFAWRNPMIDELRIWEIDHPATQHWKRRALGRAGVDEPANVTFVPLDLAASSLGSQALPTLATWNWLGVTMYLEKEATVEVLRVIASKQEGSTLVVNFLLAEPELDDLAKAVRSASAKAVARAGEPIRSTYTRSQCVELLETAGFGSIDLFDADALALRYFPARRDLRLPDSTLVAVAQL